MNNVDIEDAQLWSITVVGNFLNNIRKIPAHQAPNYLAQPERLTPLYVSVNEINKSALIRIVLDCISEDTFGAVHIKKQVVLNTLGEYEAAALACGEYLNRPNLKPDNQKSANESTLNGYGVKIYTENANFVQGFPSNFERLLQSNLQEAWNGLNITSENKKSFPHAKR